MSAAIALDIPVTAPRVTATLEQTHVTFQATPSANPLFAYRLAIPKAWAYSAAFGPVPDGPFATQGLGFMTGSARPGAPVVAVTVTPLPFEIPVDTWARLSLAAEGWTIVAARWFPGAKGLFFDITGTRTKSKAVEDVDDALTFGQRALLLRENQRLREHNEQYKSDDLVHVELDAGAN